MYTNAIFVNLLHLESIEIIFKFKEMIMNVFFSRNTSQKNGI